MSHDTEIAGYVRQVHDFYQIIIRNAGHMVPHDQPRVALDMISRFINNQSFSL
jgi:vitellogenic carboxypeptidase-like protein